MQKIKQVLALTISIALFVILAYNFLPKVSSDELRFERPQDSEESITRIIAHAWDSDRYSEEFIDIHLIQLQGCMEGKPTSAWIPFSVLPGATPADADVCDSFDGEWYLPEKYHETARPQSFDQCYKSIEKFNALKASGILLNGEPAPFDSSGCMRDLRDNEVR